MLGVITRDINRRIGKAMHTYDMLADGDRVLAAVSGGIDSLVLAWLLHNWQRKTPIAYHLLALHVDMAPENSRPGLSARNVMANLDGLGIASAAVPASRPAPVLAEEAGDGGRNICYICSSARRSQLFDYARLQGFNKIAFGHHQDDIIETFFLNLCCAGNISTMVPRQDLFEGRLSLIRPLSFVSRSEIEAVAARLSIRPVRSGCPLSEHTRRADIRGILGNLYAELPGARQNIFAALSNVRSDYLLKRVRKEKNAHRS
jgi:tRNA 2-thiocytidine biosynthesis protein TtcA